MSARQFVQPGAAFEVRETKISFDKSLIAISEGTEGDLDRPRDRLLPESAPGALQVNFFSALEPGPISGNNFYGSQIYS